MFSLSVKVSLLTLATTFLLVGCQNAPPTPESPKPPVLQPENTPNLSETEAETPPEPEFVEIDLSAYFNGYPGSAVFYIPYENTYKVYQLDASTTQRSPCSTFKIVSTLAALEYGIITPSDSLRTWSGEFFWKKDWNKDLTLEEAFKSSCVWYYRQLIDEIGAEKMQLFLDALDYGNGDISDWEGKLNLNNSNPALTGFWIESSLKISPLEQVQLLAKIFDEENSYKPEHIQLLKALMAVDEPSLPVAVYGKTGYGRLKEVSLDSWFVGMFESDLGPIYFAIHLADVTDSTVNSAVAKSIALEIIQELFVAQ